MLITQWLRHLEGQWQQRARRGQGRSRRQRLSRRGGSASQQRFAEVLEPRVVLSAPNPVNVASLTGTNGFAIAATPAVGANGTGTIYRATSPGDFTGDGVDDLNVIGVHNFDVLGRSTSVSLIGAHGRPAGDLNGDGSQDYFNDLARSSVQFGHVGVPFQNGLTLNGSNGFRLNDDAIGFSPLGDINGDGCDDLMTDAGEIVFGHTGAFPAIVTPGDPQGGTFANVANTSGVYATPIGDITGDGIDDIVVNVVSSGGLFIRHAVLFGRRDLAGVIFPDDLDGTQGFVLDVAAVDLSAAAAGDVNGDGVGDLVLGNSDADAFGVSGAGSSYVVFGRTTGFAASLNLTGLNGANGFLMYTARSGDRLGVSVAGNGDVNGDGYDDVIVAAPAAGTGRVAETFVVFGHGGSFAASTSLLFLNGDNGFRIQSPSMSFSNLTVAGGFDQNGDGFDDVAVTIQESGTDLGHVYVVFGGNFSGATVGTAGPDGGAGRARWWTGHRQVHRRSWS